MCFYVGGIYCCDLLEPEGKVIVLWENSKIEGHSAEVGGARVGG